MLRKILPKMVSCDSEIFVNVLQDVFPETVFPNTSTHELKHKVKSILDARGMYNGTEFVQQIVNIRHAIKARHGVMLLGRA
jgi:hypothetical protein